MSDFVPRPEFERTIKSTDDHLSNISINVSKISTTQQKFINAQTELNTKIKCKIKEVEKTQNNFMKIGLIVLSFFSGFAGIGYSAWAQKAETEQPEPEKAKETEVLVSINHD